jgi:hypothetical protein
MSKYKIENINGGTCSALIVVLTYENIFGYLEKIEKELADRNISGKIIFDNLLKSGNNKERFIAGFFDGKTFDKKSFEFISLERTDSIRVLSCSLLKQYENVIEMSTLNKFERDLLMSGLSI